MEMTKWFDTNYHYIVPEFCEGQKFTFASAKVVNEFQEALSLGIKTSLFCLEVYLEVLQRLASAQAEWVQFDEPALALDLTSAEAQVASGTLLPTGGPCTHAQISGCNLSGRNIWRNDYRHSLQTISQSVSCLHA